LLNVLEIYYENNGKRLLFNHKELEGYVVCAKISEQLYFPPSLKHTLNVLSLSLEELRKMEACVLNKLHPSDLYPKNEFFRNIYFWKPPPSLSYKNKKLKEKRIIEENERMLNEFRKSKRLEFEKNQQLGWVKKNFYFIIVY
jgi:hypothetical protein